MTAHRFRALGLAACWGVLTAVFGCSFGPTALHKTHGLYAESVSDVEREQLLREIVHLRYNESFTGLDISSIAAQYELSGSAEARPFFVAPNPGSNPFTTFTSILPDVSLGGANRPTMTYSPMDDGATIRQFLTPITLDTLVFLTQTSWPVSTVLRLWTERLNGVPNAVTTSGPQRNEVPDFERFLHIAGLLQAAQDKELAAVRKDERIVELSGPLAAEAVTPAAAVEAAKAGLEYRLRPDGKTWALTRRERRLEVAVSPGAEFSPELTELEGLLNLIPGARSYDLAIAARGNPDPLRFPTMPTTEVRIVPRSTSQVLYYMSNGIEVPVEHIAGGLVHPAIGPDGRAFDSRKITQGLFQIHTCKGHKPPPTAYIAIHYRGYWYYIDDCDADSKATFALVLHLSRLDFSRQSLGVGPALTLPVGR
jgi:hypothetical protein